MSSFQSACKAQSIREQLTNGLIAAAPIPFDEDGKLHESGHQSYLRHMAQQPITGLAVWAHTGRGLMLDGLTAQRVLVDWRAALPGQTIIAGVGSRDSDPEKATASTMKMAESAARSGAD